MKTYKLWDKKSSINGVKPHYILDNEPYKSAKEIYIVYENNEIKGIKIYKENKLWQK